MELKRHGQVTVKLPAPTSATDAVIDAIAVARLTRLVQQDDVWPMPEFREWWRGKVGESRLVDLIVCPFCLGMWMSALVVVLRIRCPRTWPWIARVLVGSSVSGHLAHLAE